MASASPISPTFYGYIASTQDALLLFEACLSGGLNHVVRRPHDRERSSLIKSGNIFIYREHSSGIKRWTDGVAWSPSRILGNFLVYRELERPFPPGEKKRAMKRSKRSTGISKSPEPYGASSNGLSNVYNATPANASPFDSSSPGSLSKETERSLIGSLVDSYGFKEKGLVKKTLSVTIGGVSHHLVSYYTIADVLNNKFSTPTKNPRFQHVTPRPDLITKQNFRTPIEEIDNLDRVDERSVNNAYAHGHNGFEVTNQSRTHFSLSHATPPLRYPEPSGSFSNYTLAPESAYSDGAPHYGNQTDPSLGFYQAPKTENYETGIQRQQRYNSVIGISSEYAHTQISSTSNLYARRPSNYDQSGGSFDSGISGISSGSKDSGYSSTGFYSSLREDSTGQHSYTTQRSLPTPTTQVSYERQSTTTYDYMGPPVRSGVMWSLGNESSGHAQYETPQRLQHQQWRRTGAS